MSTEYSKKEAIIVVLLLLVSLLLAAILMELSFTFIIATPHFELSEKMQPVDVSSGQDIPKPPKQPITPKEKPRCETNYFAVFRKEESLLCAEVEHPPISGPPTKLFFPDGLTLTETDLAAQQLCLCLASQAGYEETSPISLVPPNSPGQKTAGDDETSPMLSNPPPWAVPSQAGDKETLFVKRVSNVRLSGTETPIEKWVCGDSCQETVK